MADDHLSPEAAAALALGGGEDPPHVLSCAACRADVASLRQVIEDLRALPDPPAALLETAKAYYRRRRAIDSLVERLIEDPALRELHRPSGDLARRIAAKAFLQ